MFGRSCPQGKTAFEAFYKAKPSLEQAHVWGCLAYAHVPDALRHKLEPKAVRCVFIGVSEHSKAWRLYDRTKRRVIVSRSVVFDDNVFPMRTPAQPRTGDMDLLYHDDEITHFERRADASASPHVPDDPVDLTHDAPIDLGDAHDAADAGRGNDYGVEGLSLIHI